MALLGSFGNILGAASRVLATVPGPAGVFGAIGSALFAPQPSSQPSVVPAGGPVIPVAAKAPQIAAGAGTGALAAAGRFGRRMLIATLFPILQKIAHATGRSSITLRQAVRIARKAGKLLEPAAVAAAMGITLAELAQLIVSDAQMPRRRMNPANVRALRRSLRRIEAFHRLCGKVDILRRARSRRRSACPPRRRAA